MTLGTPFIGVFQSERNLGVISFVHKFFSFPFQPGLFLVHTCHSLKCREVSGIDFPVKMVDIDVLRDVQFPLPKSFEKARLAAAIGAYKGISPARLLLS